MLILFLFFQLFSITLQDIVLVIDTLFLEKILINIDFKNCTQKQPENFYYKGKPENILNIKNKYDSYSSVYIIYISNIS